MCTPQPNPVLQAVTAASPGTAPPGGLPPAGPTVAPRGSRRTRLWSLEDRCLCPVIGVCLPIGVLRRMAGKLLGQGAPQDDYSLHCGTISECRQRGPMAEAVQHELDRRYATALRQAARAKDREALVAWWQGAATGSDLAGALWATLTHARCDAGLTDQVLGQVHMLQHQVGVGRTVDLRRHEALIEENGVLTRALAAAQQRVTRLTAQHARQAAEQQAALARLGAERAAGDAMIESLRAALARVEAMAPELPTRFKLARENEALVARLHASEQALLAARQDAERERRRADAQASLPPPPTPSAAAAADEANQACARRLDDRSVLCVGGRQGSLPIYRRLVERTGGRFLHHDGGEEHNPARLDATLAAADLVICQTGCVSHDAYWRVKDHCRRTGKQCLFVHNPSRTSLQRALQTLVQAGSEGPEPERLAGALDPAA